MVIHGVMLILILQMLLQPFVTVNEGVVPDVEFKPGDVLLLKGEHSPMHGDWKHIALCIDEGCVVEASASYDVENHVWITHGVVYTRLEDLFCRGAQEVLVMRLEDNPQAIEAAIEYAESQVGKEYDWLLCGLDEHFQYCSELIRRAYLVSGIDLDSDGGLFVSPDDIANSPLLTEIYQGPCVAS